MITMWKVRAKYKCVIAFALLLSLYFQ